MPISLSFPRRVRTAARLSPMTRIPGRPATGSTQAVPMVRPRCFLSSSRNSGGKISGSPSRTSSTGRAWRRPVGPRSRRCASRMSTMTPLPATRSSPRRSARHALDAMRSTAVRSPRAGSRSSSRRRRAMSFPRSARFRRRCATAFLRAVPFWSRCGVRTETVRPATRAMDSFTRAPPTRRSSRFHIPRTTFRSTAGCPHSTCASPRSGSRAPTRSTTPTPPVPRSTGWRSPFRAGFSGQRNSSAR